jgi:predicted dehydrogenase
MVRVAIIGLGGVAERIHLPACRKVAGLETAGLQIVGAAEPVRETREAMAARFQLPHAYETPEELFAGQKPEVVLIGTPPDSHYSLCRFALERGAHVFCEKPFMATLEQADDIIAVARQQRRLVAVNNQYRYMEIYDRTRQRLAAGDFGRLYAIQCWQQMFHPPSNEKVAWRRALKQSALFEFGTHALDLICCFFDDLPERLMAHMPRARPEYDSDVLVQMSLRFPAERLATLFLNRVSHAPERYLEMRLDCEKASVRLSLGGVARASIEWSGRLGRPTGRFSFERGGEARAERGGRSTAYVRAKHPAFMPATAAHLERFLVEIRKDPLDYGPVEHAREVLRLALAGYESAASGEVVRFAR